MLDQLLKNTEVFNCLIKEREKDGKIIKRSIGSLFGGNRQRCFKNILMGVKVPHTAREVLKLVRDGFSVVIGLQSTGEANATQQAEDTGTGGALS
jgi:hypothetical protein